MKLVPTAALHRWVADLWRAAGCDEREATLTADHLVAANLAGHDSHGVGMVPRYVDSWLAGELQLNRHPRIVSDSDAMLTLDGDRGMGQAVTQEAMGLAIERARSYGVCMLGLRHTHHLGRVGHWAEQAIAAGMASIHFVNVVSKPVVAPFGGTQARFITNPFTIGVPVPGREPVLLDFATSAIALGKVRVAHNKGVPVPPGSLLDAQGRPTDEPAVMFPPAGAATGAMLPFGQHKGYALAMMCELLGAALIGGHTPRPLHTQMQHAIWNNMLAIVFDPARLGALDGFGAEFKAFAEWVQSAPPQPGGPGVLMPGDPERRMRGERARAVPIDAGTLAQMDAAAAKVKQACGAGPEALSRLVIAGPADGRRGHAVSALLMAGLSLGQRLSPTCRVEPDRLAHTTESLRDPGRFRGRLGACVCDRRPPDRHRELH